METFRRGRWGWMRSSDGYSVRLLGRSRLQYKDEHGQLHIHAEAMSKPWSNIVVDTKTISDGPTVTRDEIIRRLHRAFEFAGWTLIEAPGREQD